MSELERSQLLQAWQGEVVVVDLQSPYVCIGTLFAANGGLLDLRDADLHDFRDGQANRETYIFDSRRYGVRRNRARVLVRGDEVVAIGRLADVLEA